MNNYLKTLSFLALGIGSISQSAFLPVCERTEAVKGQLQTLTTKVCADITETDLLAIKRVTVQNKGIREFKADDFSGLKNLEILNIRSNPYVTLPEGLFNDLGNLKTIVIIGNEQFRYLPDDLFEKTPLLTHVHIFRTGVRSISESVLTRLANLKNLQELDLDESLQEAERVRLRQIFPENGKVFFNFN